MGIRAGEQADGGRWGEGSRGYGTHRRLCLDPVSEVRLVLFPANETLVDVDKVRKGLEGGCVHRLGRGRKEFNKFGPAVLIGPRERDVA